MQYVQFYNIHGHIVAVFPEKHPPTGLLFDKYVQTFQMGIGWDWAHPSYFEAFPKATPAQYETIYNELEGRGYELATIDLRKEVAA